MRRNLRTPAAKRPNWKTAWPVLAGLLLVAGVPTPAQERRTNRIDVQKYTIDAEIVPATSTLAVRAAVLFTPIDDNIGSATFELNNALNIARVVDEQGRPIPASRNPSDSTVRLTFEPAL